jgi:hypothetical protein
MFHNKASTELMNNYAIHLFKKYIHERKIPKLLELLQVQLQFAGGFKFIESSINEINDALIDYIDRSLDNTLNYDCYSGIHREGVVNIVNRCFRNRITSALKMLFKINTNETFPDMINPALLEEYIIFSDTTAFK